MSNANTRNPKNAGPAAKPAEAKPGQPAKTPASQNKPPVAFPAVEPPPPAHVPALFRPIDWITFGITTLIVMLSYWWTLAPDLTLEDSGELAVGSFYAGVPHPPGYPVWTMYTWLFTVLVPISNIAYRVALSSAVAGALSCGMIALMVSRGSSMMIEGIADLKTLERRWEDVLCVVAGLVAGLLMGFNGFMWSQAVIVEVYTLSVLSLTGVLLCLMRWIYAPHQHRYLYMAFFWFGICFNNHQSLLVIALGLEAAIYCVQPRLARDILFWNVIIYLSGLVLKSMGIIGMLSDNLPLLLIYHAIGLASVVTWIFLLIRARKTLIEFARDMALVATLGYLAVLFGHITNYVGVFYYKDSFMLKTSPFVLFNIVGIACMAVFVYLILRTIKLGREWIQGLLCGGAWSLGGAFYLYMPLAGMSNPPMQWGYPRTVQGFFHAFTRGQYERIHPTFGNDFLADMSKFIGQLGMYIGGAFEEFNVIYIVIGLIPFLFLRKMQRRERAWLIGLAAVYITLSFFLLILLNPASDRQSRDLNKPFFTASHVMIAMGIGYGLTLIGATLATQYQRYKTWAVYGFGLAAVVALFGVWDAFYSTENPLIHYTSIFALVLAVAGVLVFWLRMKAQHAPVIGLAVVFAAMPVYSVMSHWENNEQRGHLFGYWFGHDMFTPPFKMKDGSPIYPEMARDTVLYGGTDPGRFNPTYMIFCESFIPPSKKPNDPNFDRRDVYLITQNALADGTYLQYIRAHYNRSAQVDTPFFSELFRGERERGANYFTNFIARMMVPLDRYFTDLGDRIEKRRRVGSSFFQNSDFADLNGFAAKLRNGGQTELSRYLFNRLSKETQTLLNSGAATDRLRSRLAEDLNKFLDAELAAAQRLTTITVQKDSLEKDIVDAQKLQSEAGAKRLADLLATRARLDQELQALSEISPFYTSNRFAGITLNETTARFTQQNPQIHNRIRLSRLLLEAAFPTELARSKGGVYPDREILTASNEDSQKCFQEYLGDAQRRLDHDRKFPNEPRQIRPGEDVRVIENRVQVSGQVAVMAINALLTKVMFDANPDHEFYVEESFPLDWMYPHLTPFGIIMKINRNPLPELNEDVVNRDHEFWSQFSNRLIGNWITYDTTVSNICQFAETTYHRRDYSKFKGDPKFVRDNDGQKAFSKLRSSIAGVYNWRIANAKTPVEQARMLKEAEFAFKQAYAFCPYSPEAVFRYINLLIGLGRVDDARLIAVTSRKLDPNNPQMDNLVMELDRIKGQQAAMGLPPQAAPPAPSAVQAEISALEQQLRADSNNFQAAYKLVADYMQVAQAPKAAEVLEQLMANPKAGADAMTFAASMFMQLGQVPGMERALGRLVAINPDNPEGWFDLAAVQTMLSKPPAAVQSLSQSLEKSAARLSKNPQAKNLYSNVLTDTRFDPLRSLPDFQKLMASHQPK